MKNTTRLNAIVWTLAFSALIVNLVLSTMNVNTLISNDLLLANTREIQSSLEQILSDLKDAETGQRGFQITNSEEYLQPYKNVRDNMDNHLQRLDALLSNNPAQKERFERLRTVIDKKMLELQSAVDARRHGDREGLEIILKGEGKRLMDEIRARIEEMNRIEEKNYLVRDGISQRKYQTSTITNLFGGIITILMVGLAYSVVRQELRRRHKAEQSLRQSNERLDHSHQVIAEALAQLDAFLKNAPVAIAFLNEDLHYMRVNPLMSEMNGRPVAVHLGRSPQEVVAEFPTELLSDYERVLHTGVAIPDRLLEGEPGNPISGRSWLVSIFPVRDSLQKMIGVGAMARDITERIHSERKIAQSEERFRTLLEAVPLIVWIGGPDGSNQYFNSRWYQYTGAAAEETAGFHWSRALHPDDRAPTEEVWKHSTETGDLYEIEFRLRRSDGEYRWFLSRARPEKDERGKILRWFGTMTDIHDQKMQATTLEGMVEQRTLELTKSNAALKEEIIERIRLEERERSISMELRRSNEELEKFAYVASHDLQEPLRKIQAFGDRLNGKFHKDLGEQGRAYLERMLGSAARMRQLIDDLLSYSRITSKPRQFETVDLNIVAQEVVSDLEARIAQTGAEVRIGPLPSLKADALQMRQLLQNLLSNALKFQKPGTSPTITVAGAIIGTPLEGSDNVVSSQANCRIVVSDNGIGFDEKYLDRIFQVFQRLHGREEYEGTGVGLAICRKIVERHGGTITARSQPGAGATFLIELPASPSNLR